MGYTHEVLSRLELSLRSFGVACASSGDGKCFVTPSLFCKGESKMPIKRASKKNKKKLVFPSFSYEYFCIFYTKYSYESSLEEKAIF